MNKIKKICKIYQNKSKTKMRIKNQKNKMQCLSKLNKSLIKLKLSRFKTFQKNKNKTNF